MRIRVREIHDRCPARIAHTIFEKNREGLTIANIVLMFQHLVSFENLYKGYRTMMHDEGKGVDMGGRGLRGMHSQKRTEPVVLGIT